MLKFSLRDVFRGMTLASIGFGMLAVAFRGVAQPAPPALPEPAMLHEFLVAFGGTFIGYGFAFPVKFPPHQMIMAMLGMFAAQACESGSYFGPVVFVALLLLNGGLSLLGRGRTREPAEPRQSE